MKINRLFPMQFLIGLIVPASLSAATVDGIPLHSTIRGTGPHTVMLVHGWTCDETTWEYQVPALAAKYRVITLDLPGHGQSGSPANGKFSMDLFAQAVEAVRSEAKADPVVLVGHSMGTPVILQYARLYPQHVRALVLVDGPVALPPNAPSPEQFTGPDGLKVREDLIRSLFSASTTPKLQHRILSMMLSVPAATAAGAMRAALDPAIWKEDTFPQPTLGIYADHTAMADPQYLKTRFPKLQYYEIPGTGHFLMLEKPEEFNRLLLGFLDKLKY